MRGQVSHDPFAQHLYRNAQSRTTSHARVIIKGSKDILLASFFFAPCSSDNYRTEDSNRENASSLQIKAEISARCATRNNQKPRGWHQEPCFAMLENAGRGIKERDGAVALKHCPWQRSGVGMTEGDLQPRSAVRCNGQRKHKRGPARESLSHASPRLYG